MKGGHARDGCKGKPFEIADERSSYSKALNAQLNLAICERRASG